MAQEPDLAAEDPAVIRQQIEETRSSLTEKLESLEHEVKETVVGAREAVTGTVEAVKETVSETVDTVKRTFDLRHQVNQHPWPMMGGSFAAGFIAGSLVPMPAGRSTHGVERGDTTSYRPVENAVSGPPRTEQANGSGPGLLATLGKKFEPEINKLKGLAIGATMGVLRDLIAPSLPGEMAPQIRGLIDDITVKLGGEPFQGSVLEAFSSDKDRSCPPAAPRSASRIAY